MKVVILAGGMGTRLAEETDVRPKPMVEIGGRPILWHIMQHFSAYGFEEFVVCLGYKGEYIKRYMTDHARLNSDLTVQLRTGDVMRRGNGQELDWIVDLVDTGLHTATAGRLKRVQHLVGNSAFLLTYGDGVSNVDIGRLPLPAAEWWDPRMRGRIVFPEWRVLGEYARAVRELARPPRLACYGALAGFALGHVPKLARDLAIAAEQFVNLRLLQRKDLAM